MRKHITLIYRTTQHLSSIFVFYATSFGGVWSLIYILDDIMDLDHHFCKLHNLKKQFTMNHSNLQGLYKLPGIVHMCVHPYTCMFIWALSVYIVPWNIHKLTTTTKCPVCHHSKAFFLIVARFSRQKKVLSNENINEN